MQMAISESDIEQQFLKIALRRSEFLRRNEPKKANKEFDSLDRILAEMRQMPDRGEAALKRIAAATNDGEVQIAAAAGLLSLDEPHAIELLEKIAARPNGGLVSFTAEMTLSEWRKGGMQSYRT